MKIFIAFSLYLILLTNCSAADVECTYDNPALTMTSSPISIQRDVAVDTPIGQEMTVDESNSHCSAHELYGASYSVAVKATQADSGKKINGRSIFLTNIPGVGYAIGINNWSWNNVLHWVGDGYDGSGNITHSSGTAWPDGEYHDFETGSTIHIQLYKIDTIKSGVLSSNLGQLSGDIITNLTSTILSPTSVPVNVNTTLNVLQCMLNNNSLSFDMGDVAANQFTTKGSISSKVSTLSLNLNCDPDANINITLIGDQNPDSSDNSILALSNQGRNDVADGVGVQLLYNNAPLKLNEMLNLKVSSGGQENFPITARYIQTKEKVIAGSANAIATLNLTYQ